MAGAAKLRPFSAPLELMFEFGPLVPKIVTDPPHIGVLADVRAFGHGGFSGRQAEDHRSTSVVDGGTDALDLGFVIGPAEIDDFDEVDLPFGEKREDRIVVGL